MHIRARTASMLLVLSGLVGWQGAVTQEKSPTIIDVANSGAIANSGNDATQAVQAAIRAAAQVEGPVRITFHAGRYDFFPEHATRMKYWISNTCSHDECSDETKTIGIYLHDMRNLTIDGEGALLMFHGKMLTIALDGCQNVLLHDLHIDFARPTMSEMTVVAVGDHSLDARVHPDSPYRIEDGKLVFIGEGWTSHGDLAQSYDPVRDTTWRSWNPSSEATGIEELKPFLLRFTYPHKPDAWVGLGFQLRETVRDEVGVFMLHCRFVTWRNVGFHYLHGLGIVGQFSEDLTFQHIACEPRVETGRTCAGFADFMQMSGCRGLVSVLDSRFLGSHDDPINVHGTHLRIVERPAPDRIKVRFMHGQSYGFEAFTVGDQLEFIHARTLLSYGAGAVKSVERLDPYTIMLTLAQPMPDGFLDEDCVENVTWTPDVEIRGCRFGRDPTRGILVTTRGKVIIANNVFVRTTQCAILIADDARNWYESGPVHDVTIIGNQFIETGEPVIAISPEIVDRVPGQYVHHNIRIIDNIFRRSGGGMPIVASSTDGITCTGNIIVQPGGGSADNMIRLEGCAHALVAGNRNALARTQAPFPLDGSRNVGLTTGHAVLCVSSAENPRDDHDVEGAPLRIGSHAFMHGIGLHAPAELIFHLGASYHWFTTAVGINASVGAKGSAALEVWLDGKRFSQTPVLHGGDAPLFLCIPVTGVTEVRLVANDAGDGNAEDHLVLGEPRVLIDTRAPAPPAP